jgi:CubicO group peptidase (beta-lactamase class C family)
MPRKNSSIIAIWLSLLLALILAGCDDSEDESLETEVMAQNLPVVEVVQTQPAAVPQSGMSTAVDELMATFITADSPGGVVMVIRDGQIIHQGSYGLADLDQQKPATTQTIFHLGSVGKIFTGLAIMILAENGQIEYDDPIDLYLPELDWLEGEVTIRHLLHHTSGLTDYYDDEELYDALLALDETPTNETAVALLAEEGDLIATPGDEFEYSNTGYDLLGLIVERVSGQPFAVFMQQNVFGPLAMNDTFSLPDNGRLANPRIASSYTDENGQPALYASDPFDNLVGSGSIYSTIGDFYLFDQALYTDRPVSQTTLAEAFAPAELNSGEESAYGFGWEVETHNGTDYAGHTGAWLGFLSYYVRFPDQRLSVIVLLNRDYDVPDDDPALMVADLFLR